MVNIKNQKNIAECILFDCKSFYYVYYWIFKEEEIPIFKGNQEEFSKAIDIYFSKKIKQPSLIVPQWTNGALAVELGLKFLYVIENQKIFKTHSLYDLFYQLPTVHKDILINRIKKQAFQSDETFEKQIRIFSDAFVKSRYFFEYDSVAMTGIFDSFIQITCAYVFEVAEKIISEKNQNIDKSI